MKIRITSIITFLLCSMAFPLFAQDSPLDTLTSHVAGIRQEFDVLKRLKVNGYIQAQFQVADSMGQPSFAGGNFPAGIDKRFAIRRGRIRFQFDAPVNEKGNSTSQYVLQFDVTEGGVNIKDAFAKFTDPWSGWFSVTAGMENRPFGFEIVYSSNMRESPERGRMSQIIFRNERDLGAMISVQGPKSSNWNWLKIDGGYFNGVGAPSALATGFDFDKKKDFIGHIAINRSNKSEMIKYGLGASYYDGGYRLDNDTIFSLSTDDSGVKGYQITSSTGNKGKFYAKRKYIGFDAQLSIDWIIGITTVRAEYISGDQPNVYASSVSPFAAVTAPIYNRKFNGAYFYFLQNIGQTPLQTIIKYDWYDPNTDIEKDEVGKTVNNGLKATNSTDVKYSTIGLGLAYRWDANLKIIAYYDIIKNETSSNLSAIYRTNQLDNVFTLRAQIKF